MIFIGDDWAEDHHDVYLMDEAGRRLASRRPPEGLTGIRGLHELVAAQVLPVQHNQWRDVFAFITQLAIGIIFDDWDSVLVGQQNQLMAAPL